MIQQFRFRCQLIRFFTTSTLEYDVAVIGAGPGGYVAAIRAAQLGLKTACIEKRPTLGGTCLNVGCIPSKALLNNSFLFEQSKHDFKSRGIELTSPPQLNLKTMMEYKEKTVTQLTKGIEFLFKKNKVDWIKGSGSFLDCNSILIKDPNTGSKISTIKAKNIIIASGSNSVELPGVKIDEERILSSTGALSLNEVPKKMVVIGGGVIGLELGSVWSRLGSQVTIVEYLNSIGAGMDQAVSSTFQKILAKQGLNFKLGTKVTGLLRLPDNSISVKIQSNSTSSQEELNCDAVLVCVGRRSFIDELGLSTISDIKLDNKGRITTDKQFRTSVSNIFAIGDVTSGPMLAHKAEDEGIYVADLIAGKASLNENHHLVIPSVVYTHPEVAWAGFTEDELKTSNRPFKASVFPFLANSRAKVNNDFEGFIKILSSPEEELLGCHIIGPNAGEMIGEVVLAMQNSITVSQIATTCHAHPTLSEAFKEVCLALSYPTFKPIHF